LGDKPYQKQNAELSKVMAEINKKYGLGTAVEGSKASALDISRLSTGSFSLDVELGGGLPEDRITLIAGPYGSAKSTLALKVVANAQRKYPHRRVLWVDAEGALDLEWAEKNGVDLDNLVVVRPTYAEQALDIVDTMVRTQGVSLVVVDSMAALLPAREMEQSMEDFTIGLSALLNSKFMRKVTSSLRYGQNLTEERDGKTTIVLLNQLREKIGAYGNPETMPGGRALAFYATVIVYLRRGDWKTTKINGRDEEIGQECKFIVDKNRTFPPKRKGVFDLYFNAADGFEATQIDRLKEVVTYAVLWDVIVRKGAWYFLGDEKFQGAEALIRYLRETPKALAAVEEKVMALATRGKDQPITTVGIDPETGEVLSTGKGIE